MAQSAQIKKVNTWHERLCDWLLANPDKRRKEAAQHFGVTQAWLSTVINSDAFQDYYRERSSQVTEGVIQNVREKMLGAADQAVEELQRRLEHPLGMTTGELLEITDVMTKRAIPASTSSQPQAAIQQNLFVVPRSALAEARAAMRAGVALLGPSAPAIEGEAVEIVQAEGGDFSPDDR